MSDPACTDPGCRTVLRLLGERTGLRFAPPRDAAAEAGVRRVMARAGVASFEQYHRLLEANPGALDDLIAELTVGETYFFREPGHFDWVARAVLPDVGRRRGAGHTFRAWSSGCASGEEAYSLAIVLEEAWAGRPAFLLATDVSRAALARAAEASYGTWSLRGEGAARAGPYLHRSGDRHLLAERVRRRVHLAYLNLALDAYPSFATGAWGMDLILCRNVLIYFDDDTVHKVARRLFDTLAPGGWLITASSDPPLAGDAPYETVITPAGVVYRRPDGVAWAQPAPTVPEEPAPRRPAPPPRKVPAAPAVPPPEPSTAERVRTLANVDPAQAERFCAEAAGREPLSAELHYLHAVLLLDLGRDAEAEQALRRVLFLDRSLAVAHYTSGTLAARRGDRDAARRAYRNARDLCAGRPAEEAVPLAEGEPAGRLAEAAAAALALLDRDPEVPT